MQEFTPQESIEALAKVVEECILGSKKSEQVQIDLARRQRHAVMKSDGLNRNQRRVLDKEMKRRMRARK